MTLKAMQDHESVTLHFGPTDFRRLGLLQTLIPRVEGQRVLDMRSLGAELLHTLQNQGMQVFGLDGLQEAADNANSLLQSKPDSPSVYCWNLEDLPKGISEQQFDSIICADLLNHVPNDSRTLQNIHSMLQDGGKLLLLVPAHPILHGVRDDAFGHLRRYTKNTITDLLESSGFEVSSIAPFNFLGLPPYVLVEKILRRKIEDPLRYTGAKPSSKVLGPLLRWWYKNIESRCLFPCGLSYFVEAFKPLD